jgi:hypothetical protein
MKDNVKDIASGVVVMVFCLAGLLLANLFFSKEPIHWPAWIIGNAVGLAVGLFVWVRLIRWSRGRKQKAAGSSNR